MNDDAVRPIVHTYLPVDRYTFRERTVTINTLLTNTFGVVKRKREGKEGKVRWPLCTYACACNN